jgi:hypothetical protein
MISIWASALLTYINEMTAEGTTANTAGRIGSRRGEFSLSGSEAVKGCTVVQAKGLASLRRVACGPHSSLNHALCSQKHYLRNGR